MIESAFSQAQRLASALPPVLAEAEHLATSVLQGAHGRRRSGSGDHFWQYRRAENWDDAARIDWRRSGRSDQLFVQEREWQLAQSVHLWVDPSAAMRFASTPDLPQKAQRARVLALALAVLLERGGERLGPIGGPLRKGRGAAAALSLPLLEDSAQAYAPFPQGPLGAQSQTLLISDFLGPLDGLDALLAQSRGVLVQLLDPAEESFPYQGHSLFEHGQAQFETPSAQGLKAAYLARLAARRDEIRAHARTAGWRFLTVSTATPAASSLVQLCAAFNRTI